MGADRDHVRALQVRSSRGSDHLTPFGALHKEQPDGLLLMRTMGRRGIVWRHVQTDFEAVHKVCARSPLSCATV